VAKGPIFRRHKLGFRVLKPNWNAV